MAKSKKTKAIKPVELVDLDESLDQQEQKIAQIPLNNVSAISYTGLVDITYKTKTGKKINFKSHNEGLPAMFKFICKCIAGRTNNLLNEKPSYLDLRCTYSDSTDPTKPVKTVNCLYSPIALSDPKQQYNKTLQAYTTVFTITLSYNMIDYNIVDAHPDGEYYIYLVSAINEDFARLKLSDNGLILTRVQPGTQAIIEWTILLQNKTSN